MNKYSRFQFGWVIVVIFTGIIIWMTLAYIHHWGNNPIRKPEYILFLILFGSLLLTFFGMRVSVDEKFIAIKFGIGLFGKRVAVNAVRSVQIVKYPVYYGYGIRIVPGGILYNVSGRKAVEIRLKNKKGVIQIGTNDAEELVRIIESMLT
jgi:hypothetical protein